MSLAHYETPLATHLRIWPFVPEIWTKVGTWLGLKIDGPRHLPGNPVAVGLSWIKQLLDCKQPSVALDNVLGQVNVCQIGPK